MRDVSPPLSPLRPGRTVKDAVAALSSPSTTDIDDDKDLENDAPTNYQAFALLLHSESHEKVLAVIRGLGLDPRQKWIGDNATLHEILRPIVAPSPPAPETPDSPSDSEESDESF
jgi:hypothetical protein